MLLLILCLICCVVVTWNCIKDDFTDAISYPIAFILDILIIGVFSFIAVSGGYICKGYARWVETQTVPIYSLSSSNGISGSFFLGSGSVDGAVYIRYVTKTKWGQQMKTVSGDSSTLFIKQDTTPTAARLVIYQKCDSTLTNWVGFVWTKTMYVFHIPKNSIKYKFNIS